MNRPQPLRRPVTPALVASTVAVSLLLRAVAATPWLLSPVAGGSVAVICAVVVRHLGAASSEVGGSNVAIRVGLARRRAVSTLADVSRLIRLVAAVDPRRRLLGLLLAAVLLPVLTILLTGYPFSLSLADDLLIYLTAVVAVAVVGGFWPAVIAAVAASLLLNWFFTQPYHTFTIAHPDNLLALLLFVLVAIAVSSVVHVAAGRAQQAARSNAEAQALSTLARTVLGNDDTPSSVLRHLAETLAVGAELRERAADRWVTVAAAGDLTLSPELARTVRDDLQLVIYGHAPDDDYRLLEAAAGQAAAALDRDRLRTQAAHAEVLAAGNRMRTALLAAVSHDLRTPLALIKASVSSLRQTDVTWSPEDQAMLLANVEDATDKLDALIANLLDMSRLQTASLQPFLAPAAIDEIVPLAAQAAAADARPIALDIPETLPLVSTDAGLVERAVANLLSNALRYSPVGRPPRVVATATQDAVRIAVIDHGPGVAPADRERIFEPFQRLGDQDMTTGVGLGLAVARGFIEAVGGRLTASDTPGGGLTMTITLPAASRSATVTA